MNGVKLRQDFENALSQTVEGDGGGKWREAIERFIDSALSLF